MLIGESQKGTERLLHPPPGVEFVCLSVFDQEGADGCRTDPGEQGRRHGRGVEVLDQPLKVTRLILQRLFGYGADGECMLAVLVGQRRQRQRHRRVGGSEEKTGTVS